MLVVTRISFVLTVTVDSTKGSFKPSPSDVTIRATTFYKVLDSEASPLSEISVAMTGDDTATPAPKGILSLIRVRLALLTPPCVFRSQVPKVTAEDLETTRDHSSGCCC